MIKDKPYSVNAQLLPIKEYNSVYFPKSKGFNILFSVYTPHIEIINSIFAQKLCNTTKVLIVKKLHIYKLQQRCYT